MAQRQIWCLVGGNGAGKSTYYETRLRVRGLPFVNADRLASELYPDAPERFSYEAAQVAETIRERLIQSGGSFVFETVYSHPSKVDFLARAKALDYQVIVVFIGLAQIDLHMGRVHQRVHEGGHSVPEDRIEPRIIRMKQHVLDTIPLADILVAVDNSDGDKPFKKQLMFKNGELYEQAQALEPWVAEMFNHYLDNVC